MTHVYIIFRNSINISLYIKIVISEMFWTIKNIRRVIADNLKD